MAIAMRNERKISRKILFLKQNSGYGGQLHIEGEKEGSKNDSGSWLVQLGRWWCH